MQYLILGDVHADGQSFNKVVQFCLEQDIHLVSVGDLIDNGPDGEQVCSQFAYLLKKGKASLTWGNHEWKIYRYLKGNNVQLGPPNLVTTEQMENSPNFANVFLDVCSYAQDIIKLSESIYVTHAGVHPNYWTDPDSLKRRQKDIYKWGTSDDAGKKYRYRGQDYPIRIYEWVKFVPEGVQLFVGHDPRPMQGVPDFDNFQEQPTTYDSDYGGTTTFLDCGAGKGGKLFGAIVNTDTNIVEEYLDFTNVL